MKFKMKDFCSQVERQEGSDDLEKGQKHISIQKHHMYYSYHKLKGHLAIMLCICFSPVKNDKAH